jgi:hypothetical protein
VVASHCDDDHGWFQDSQGMSRRAARSGVRRWGQLTVGGAALVLMGAGRATLLHVVGAERRAAFMRTRWTIDGATNRAHAEPTSADGGKSATRHLHVRVAANRRVVPREVLLHREISPVHIEVIGCC